MNIDHQQTSAAGGEPASTTADHGHVLASRTRAGRILAAYRSRAGLTQAELAYRLGEGRPTLTRNDVSRWERGVRLPGRYWLARIGQVLDLPEQPRAAIVAARVASGAAENTTTAADTGAHDRPAAPPPTDATGEES